MSENPRGIPRAQFIEDVDKWTTSEDVDAELIQLQEKMSKYKYMEQNNNFRMDNLQDKVREIEKSIESINHLMQRDSSNDSKTMKFEICDTLFANATIPDKVEKVNLWLGANTMLEYPIDEALDLLKTKLVSNKKSLDNCIEDLEFLREQITTMEVNIARMHNRKVLLKQQVK